MWECLKIPQTDIIKKKKKNLKKSLWKVHINHDLFHIYQDLLEEKKAKKATIWAWIIQKSPRRQKTKAAWVKKKKLFCMEKENQFTNK